MEHPEHKEFTENTEILSELCVFLAFFVLKSSRLLRAWHPALGKIKKTQILAAILGVAFILSACGAEPEATITPIPTSTPNAPRNENVDALNAAQAALDDQDFGFAPLLLNDEAKITLNSEAGTEIARLTYPQQPADPSAWSTVDSFVSAYAVRAFMMDLSQVGRVALGHLSLSASIGNNADDMDHIAAWVTFLDGSRAIIDLTPLSTNFASRHIPDRMMLAPTEIDNLFADRRTGVDLNQLPPLVVVLVQIQ